MSAVVYDEPYKLPAGILALAVHIAFFTLLYFGVSWQVQPPQGMVVDIWDSMPEVKSAPGKVAPQETLQPKPVEPVAPPKPVELPKPVATPKADIELAEKKKAKPVETEKPVELKKMEELKKPPVEQKPVGQTEAEKAQQAAQAEQGRVQAEQDRVRAEQDRVRAEQAAAIGRVVDEHKARIVAKIRRNIVMPPDVPDNVRAEFDVVLLPGGSVLSIKLTKPSGRETYDGAVERAILKAQPLPLPQDVALFNKFRELHLIFSPRE